MEDDDEGGFRVQRRSPRFRWNNVVLEDDERSEDDERLPMRVMESPMRERMESPMRVMESRLRERMESPMRVMESRLRERRRQKKDEDMYFLYFEGKRYFKSHPLPSEKDWEIILERKERLLLSVGRNNSSPPPPLYNNDVGLVDDSNACLIFVDVNAVKQSLKEESIDRYSYHYNGLLTFAVECRYIRCLEMFDHPGQRGNLFRVHNIDIERQLVASFAIGHYNKICRIRFPHLTARLELQDILKINCYKSDSLFHAYYYVTFQAKDNVNGEMGLYQAAVLQQYDMPAVDKYLLGLLRDFSGDRILAIILLTGAAEDLKKRSIELFTI